MGNTTEMQCESQTPVKTHWWAICLVILATSLTSAGQVSLKYASEAFDLSFNGIAANWPFWVGLALYIGAAALLIMAFSGGELSVLDPMQSAAFIWTLLASWRILGEKISLHNVAGIGIILAGIVLLTSSKGGAANEPS